MCVRESKVREKVEKREMAGGWPSWPGRPWPVGDEVQREKEREGRGIKRERWIKKKKKREKRRGELEREVGKESDRRRVVAGNEGLAGGLGLAGGWLGLYVGT